MLADTADGDYWPDLRAYHLRRAPTQHYYRTFVDALNAYAEFRQHNFAAAFRLFDRSDTDPRCVLRCFTGFVSESAAHQAAQRQGHPMDVYQVSQDSVDARVY